MEDELHHLESLRSSDATSRDDTFLHEAPPFPPKFNVEEALAQGPFDSKWCSFVSIRKGGGYAASRDRLQQACPTQH